MCGQDGDNRAHHIILNGKDILEVTIVVLGPAMRTRGSIDQLRGNSNAVAAAPYAAFQHIAYAQFASYLPHIDRLVLVLEAGVAGDDKQLGEAGQLSDDVVDDAVDQIFLLWMGAQVGERKHGIEGLSGSASSGVRVSETMCKEVSVSLPLTGDSHDDDFDDYPRSA